MFIQLHNLFCWQVKECRRHDQLVSSPLVVSHASLPSGSISVVVAHDTTHSIVDGCDSSLNAISLTNESAVISLPGCGTVRGGDHVQCQKLSQNLSIKLVTLSS